MAADALATLMGRGLMGRIGAADGLGRRGLGLVVFIPKVWSAFPVFYMQYMT